jgi:UDP-N-acetylglucosamine acyltransferase
MASDDSARPYGINAEGLKRRGFTGPTITRLKRAYKTLYKSGLTLGEARRELARQVAECPEIQSLVDFLADSKRGIIR